MAATIHTENKRGKGNCIGATRGRRSMTSLGIEYKAQNQHLAGFLQEERGRRMARQPCLPSGGRGARRPRHSGETP
jgi:hypothetical protein